MAAPITLTDKLMVLPNTASGILAALARLVTGPFSSVRAQDTYRDVIYAMLRATLSYQRVGTEQYMNAKTEDAYLDLAKKHEFQPDTTVLGTGLKLHWLGSKTAKKILLFYHGGGYVLSCSAGHFEWLFSLQSDLAKSHSVSVVVVGYTLAPHAQYPNQLKEAAESLTWLLDEQKYKPSDIIVFGDSAGGNMTLSLLSHMLHPHPEVPPTNLNEPLAGAVLISPWCKFPPEDESIKRNATSDMVTPAAAKRWSSLFMGSSKPDNYNQPYLADANWFKGLDQKVKNILIWGGGGEILIDSIEAITKTLKEAHPKTELVVEPGAAHDQFILDKLIGYTDTADATKLIESWIAQRL